MLSTDQSHLRKYLATLGVAVVAGVISLSGLALRLQDDLLVKESELRELTPLARETIEQRQRLLATVTDVLPWFLVLGIVGGAALTVYGLVGWSQRQRVADRREDIGAQREEIEFERLTPVEQQERRDREAASAVADEPVTAGPPGPITQRVTALERELAVKLVAAFGSRLVETGVRAQGPGGPAEFDAMVDLPHGTAVFELKYIARNVEPMRRIREARHRAAEAAGRLGRGTVARVIVIAVLADTVDFPDTLPTRFRASDAPIDAYVFRESEFLAISPEEFAKRLGL